MEPEQAAVRALAIFGDASLSNVKSFLEAGGFTLPREGSKARAWCEALALTGDLHACYVAAEMFHLGLFGPMNQDRAMELCKRASDAGDAPALLLLASLKEDENERKALALMEESASKGYAPAIYAVALKQMVDGVDESEKQAGLRHLEQAAKRSYAPAQTTLATHLLESGLEGEIEEGMRLMQIAAGQRSSHAHRMLAHYFEAGRYGLKADSAKAANHRAEADRIEAESLLTWGVLS